jgi:hypothetical protein
MASVRVLAALAVVVAAGCGKALASSDDGEYPWLGNDLGITGEVPEPWTPVAGDEQRVEVWGRTIEFSEALLPRQITSQGVDLLAAGADVEVTYGDRRFDFPKASVRLVQQHRDRMIREATAQSGPLTCRTVTTVEFDAMIRIELTLTPSRPATIDRAAIVIPIHREVAQIYGRYLSYDFEALRTDKMSLATCTQRISGPIHSDFNPEIWIGNRDVGITWAAETNCRYDLIDATKTLSVIPGADSTDLVVTVVDHRVTLDRPKTIEFALFPTPLKPVDPRMRQIRLAAFGRLLGAFQAGISREHYDDYSIAMPREFEAEYDSLPTSSHGERYQRLRERLDEAHVKYIPYGALWYTNAVLEAPRRLYPRWHKAPVSQSTLARWQEYDRGETRDLSLMQGLHWDGYRVCASPRSYADFLVWTYTRAIETDELDGVYFDHGEVSHSCRNPNHDHFQDATGPQRKLHFGVFSARELLKRLWISGKQVNPDLIIIQHQSRSLKSLNSFVDVAVTGEAMNVLFAGSPSSRGVRENPSLYKPDYDRIPALLMTCDYLDTFGFETRILSQVKYCIEAYWSEHAAEYDDYSRRMFRHTLLNGTRHWAGNMSQTAIVEAWTALDRIGRLDSSVPFHPYWNNADTIGTTHPDTIVSYYARQGKALLFVGNLGDEKADDEVILKGPEEYADAIDAVTGEPIELRHNRVRLTVPAGLYRAVLLTR